MVNKKNKKIVGGDIQDSNTGLAAYGRLNNTKLDILVFYGIICLGILLEFIISTENTDSTGNDGEAKVSMWGYGVSLIGMFCILFIKIGLIMNNDEKMMNKSIEDLFKNISNYLNDLSVYIILIILFSFMVLINYMFYKRINLKLYSSGYSYYNYVIKLLLGFQVILFYSFLSNDDKTKNKNYTLLKAIITLLGALTFIVFIIMYIQLQYYSTDG